MHVAILEDYEECFVSNTESGLRRQVIESFAKKSLPELTDEQWADCVSPGYRGSITGDFLPFPLISYYKTVSNLGPIENQAKS